MPVLDVLFEIERNGVLLDYKLLQKQSYELGEKLHVLEQQAYTIAGQPFNCLLYTSDAADERSSVDLGGRRIIKKKKNTKH